MWSRCEELLDECAASSPDADEAHARAGFCEAMALRARGELERAATLLEDVAALDPAWAAPHAVLGTVSLELGDAAAAVDHLRHAVSLDPHWPSALNDLGLALQAAGDLEGALESLDAALALDPLMAGTHANRGGVLTQLDRSAEAVAAYLVAIELAPDEPIHYYNLAGTFELMGEHDKAASAYARMLELLPEDRTAAVHLKRGWALEAAGDLDGAEKSYRTALSLAPTSLAALSSLAALHVATGEPEAALDVYETMGGLDTQKASAELYVLGLELAAADDLELAVRALGGAVGLRPAWGEAHAALGTVLIESRALEEAAAVLEGALELLPLEAGVHHNLGVCRARMYELAAAEEHLRSALQLDPDSAASHSWLGEVLRLGQRLEEALESHDAAVSLAPDMARLHARRALTLDEMGRHAQARQAMGHALELDAGDPAVLTARGLMLVHGKKTAGEAAEAFEEALELDPAHALAHAGLALARARQKAGAAARDHLETALSLDPYLARRPWVSQLSKKLGT
jgi:tetratricopeptide (TPR) repeat protein